MRVTQADVVLPATRSNVICAYWNGYIFSVAGTEAALSALIYASKIAADGSMGRWFLAGSIPVASSLHAAVAHGGRLYVVGGTAVNSTTGDTISAAIGADGILGAWVRSPAPVFNVLLNATSYGDWLFTAGGTISSVRHGRVFAGRMSGDGIVGNWQELTRLPSATGQSGLVAHGDYLYSVGGGDGTNVLQKVHSARINGDGTIGAWNFVASLPKTWHRGLCVVHGEKLVIAGGSNDAAGTTKYSDIWVAQLGPGGGLGPWTTSQLITAVQLGYGVSDGKRVYLVGGTNQAGTRLDTIQILSE